MVSEFLSFVNKKYRKMAKIKAFTIYFVILITNQKYQKSLLNFSHMDSIFTIAKDIK